MHFKRILQTSTLMGTALFLCAGVAPAATITYTTNAAGTAFVAGNFGITPLTMHSTSGEAASLTFVPNGASISGIPSNINLGDFLLTCPTCTLAQTSIFGAFTFDLVISDTTDNATGMFVATSTGGVVSSDSSTMILNWSPATLGPGTSNALTGNFGSTVFNKISLVSAIVAPNSGTPPGDTTVQGSISSSPEPATLALMGGALIGLGLLRRKKVFKA